MSTEQDIYEAVRSSINDGWDVDKFIKVAWGQWDLVLYENGKYADMAFDRALNRQETES